MTAAVEVKVRDAMTEAECEQLKAHEETIERGLARFIEVGTALEAIRRGGLHRAEHRSFSDYVENRWRMGRRYADQLIAAATVAENLRANALTPPTNESQARPLATLPPAHQVEAWRRAGQLAEDEGLPEPRTRHAEEAVLAIGREEKERYASAAAPYWGDSENGAGKHDTEELIRRGIITAHALEGLPLTLRAHLVSELLKADQDFSIEQGPTESQRPLTVSRSVLRKWAEATVAQLREGRIRSVAGIRRAVRADLRFENDNNNSQLRGHKDAARVFVAAVRTLTQKLDSGRIDHVGIDEANRVHKEVVGALTHFKAAADRWIAITSSERARLAAKLEKRVEATRTRATEEICIEDKAHQLTVA